jgi:tetratricopeptide (TPR) repeat protein
MDKLLKLLNAASWNEVLAQTDVWATRFMLIAVILLVGGIAIQTPTESDTLRAGLAAQSQQEYWRAESFFQDAAILAPDDFRPPLDLARLHLLEHVDDLAQSEVETARNLDSTNADIWLTLGDVASDQGHQQDAEHAWLQATHLEPAAAAMQARERLGLLYEGQGRLPQAETQFAALPASDTLAQYHLGALRLERGDRAGARQALEAALSQTNDAGQRAAAQRLLAALNQWNGSAHSEQLLGYAYVQNNLPTLAKAPLQQAIALAPKDANARAYLGWVYLSLGSASQALAEERQALTLEPGNSFANYILSLLDLDAGHYSSAINDLGRALTSDPQNPVLWATRAEVAEQLGDLSFAETALRRAVDDAAGDPQFAVLLATFYADYQLGLQNGVALSAAQEAVALAPTNGLAFDALGRIQQAMNNFSAALGTLSEAVSLAPTNATFHLHLATIQAILGYIRSAALNLRKATVLDHLNGPVARQAQQLLQDLPPSSI